MGCFGPSSCPSINTCRVPDITWCHMTRSWLSHDRHMVHMLCTWPLPTIFYKKMSWFHQQSFPPKSAFRHIDHHWAHKEGGRERDRERGREGEREGDRNKGTICIRERRGRGREECKWSFLQSLKWLGEANIKWFTCLNTALQCTGLSSDLAPLGAKHMYF